MKVASAARGHGDVQQGEPAPLLLHSRSIPIETHRF